MPSTFETKQTGPERVFVKWATPTEEATGIAKLAGALIDRSLGQPGDVAVVAPNRMWATNLLRACEACKVAASLCMPQRETPAVSRALARLDQEGGELRGRSLARRTGLDALSECAHALLHIEGDETAEELGLLVRAQLARPTVPEKTPCVPIVLAGCMPSAFRYVFVAGCVNGLVPSSAALDEAQGEGPHTALERERALFDAAVDAGETRTTISCFTKAPLEFARQTRIRYSRTKTENGEAVAMVQPSMFLSEAGQQRTWGLN